MTVPEHMLLGLVTANAAAAASLVVRLVGARKGRAAEQEAALAAPGTPTPVPEKKALDPDWAKLILIGVLASIAPDVDAFFGAYTSSDPWVGHRGMTHSFLGVLVLGLAVVLFVQVLSALLRLLPGYFLFLFGRFRKLATGAPSRFHFGRYLAASIHPRMLLILWAVAFLAGTTHLLVDMPQPASVWGGLPLLFPMKTAAGAYHRIGGWGHIGWFDLVTAWGMLACFAASTAILLFSALLWPLSRWRPFRYARITLGVTALLLTCALAVWMVREIRAAHFIDEASWYRDQRAAVSKGPVWMQKASDETFRVVKSLTRQAMGLGRE